MFPIILSTFAVIFLAELPDKTAFASLALATRFPARQVVAGAWLAFLVQTVLACSAGGVLALLPSRVVRAGAGAGYLAFAAVAVLRRAEDEQREESAAVQEEVRHHRRPWISAFLVVLAAEFGDLTQLATAGLASTTGNPLAVGLGAVAALWAVTLIAVGVGRGLARIVDARAMALVSAAVFAVVGIVILATAIVG